VSQLKTVSVEDAGFCFGVRRALKLAEEATERYAEVVCLGPLIHNRQVVEGLERRGMRFVEDISQVEPGAAAMIRAHGAGPQVYQDAEARGIKLMDATCPFVRRVQQAAAQFVEEQYQVFVLGEPDHPEARAIVEHAGAQALIVEGASDLAGTEIAERVAVVCQTTQHLDKLQELVAALLPQTKELRVTNTICDATSKRQEASLRLAADVDLMIVIGGYHSANTNRLAQICAATGTPTKHIETADELCQEWLRGVKVVGLTAGASTPDEAIEAVRERLGALSAGATGGDADAKNPR
jgi:4-hydroxy-3-methylbut-2-enyl diphosphate reductase